MRNWNLVSLGLGLALSGFALGNYSFDNEDNLYNQRNSSNDQVNFDAAQKAFDAYAAIYNNKSHSTEDRLYAFTQMGRSQIYAGGMLKGANLQARKEALTKCYKIAQSARKEFVGKQEPHYFYLGCMAALAKISSVGTRLKLALKLPSAQKEALAASTVDGKLVGGFEGGGSLRVSSGIASNIKAKGVPGGFYNPKRAIELAEIALNTPTMQSHPFEPMSGKDYFDNYYYLAFAYSSLGMEEKNFSHVETAYKIVTDQVKAIDDLIEANELPKGREPETMHYRTEMLAIKSNIEACRSHASWVSCLDGRLNKVSEEIEASTTEHDDL